MNESIAFIDFDKTLYDLVMPDFEAQRNELASLIAGKFSLVSGLSPLLEEIDRLAVLQPGVREFAYSYLDMIEQRAGGYFYDYASSVLEDLSGRMPVVVVSNNCTEVIHSRLRDHDLLAYVTNVYGRGSTPYFKPMAGLLEYVCNDMKMDVAELNAFRFIGDSWRDYDCAMNFAKKHRKSLTFIHPNTFTGHSEP